MSHIQSVINTQRAYFNTHVTKEIGFRIDQLKKLKGIIQSSEQQLFDAIYEDFGKSEFETYMTELGPIYHELDGAIKKTARWSRKQRVSTDIANFPARSYIMPEPYGTALVIGAWNYPYQLSLVPAIAALAAGNTVILKPSEMPARTAQVLADLVNSNFPQQYFHVIQGGVPETTDLLAQKFDKIFFTGSTEVGKIVYQAAAKNLTPVTLELGGKSPTFVLADCDIARTAQRIAWAKNLNAGQTCVAPDYILAHESITEKLIQALSHEMDKYPQDSQQQAAHYLKIINTKNFDRLIKLIDDNKVCYGGHHDKAARFISPTLMKNVSWQDAIMQEEIFGPILPILTFKDLGQAIDQVKKRPKPLSCYIYGRDKRAIERILQEVSFGGGAINDSLMHLTNSRLPFGGVGASGMGNYHGKAGFDTFSHFKSLLHKPFWFEASLKYPPYSETKRKIIKWIMG